MKLFEIKNQTPQWLLTESAKNVHLEHIEDLVFNSGYAGAQAALNHVASIRAMLAEGTGTTSNLTVKWDGSPAIICGIDPADGRFFVGTKAVFSKESKACKSMSDIQRFYGEQPELVAILANALKYLAKLNIGGVIQGDMMFTDEMKSTANINGQDCITFTPNTITYAVPTGSALAERINRAKFGIIFHTSYQGDSLQELRSSFMINVQGLTQTADVWVDDATYKDYTGIATLTPQENTLIQQMMEATAATMEKVGPARFDVVVANKEFARYIKPFINKSIRGGTQIADPHKFLQDFMLYYTGEQTKDIENVTDRVAQNRAAKIKEKEQWIADNANNLLAVLAVYKRLVELKNMLLRKLQQVEGINTFQKTNDGYKVTTPEGFVALGHDGGAVKLVDRLEFSRINFARKA